MLQSTGFCQVEEEACPDCHRQVPVPFWVKPPTFGWGHRGMTWQRRGQTLGLTAVYPLKANSDRPWSGTAIPQKRGNGAAGVARHLSQYVFYRAPIHQHYASLVTELCCAPWADPRAGYERIARDGWRLVEGIGGRVPGRECLGQISLTATAKHPHFLHFSPTGKKWNQGSRQQSTLQPGARHDLACQSDLRGIGHECHDSSSLKRLIPASEDAGPAHATTILLKTAKK